MFIPLPDNEEAFLHYASQLQLILDIRAEKADIDMFYDWVIGCSPWTPKWTNFMLKDIEKEREKPFNTFEALYVVNTWSPIMDELEKYVKIAKNEARKNMEELGRLESGGPYLYEEFTRELRGENETFFDLNKSGILLILVSAAMSWESKLDEIRLKPFRSSGKDKIGNIKKISDDLNINIESSLSYYQLFSTIPWVTMYSAAINNYFLNLAQEYFVQRNKYSCLVGIMLKGRKPYLTTQLEYNDQTLAAEIEKRLKKDAY